MRALPMPGERLGVPQNGSGVMRQASNQDRASVGDRIRRHALAILKSLMFVGITTVGLLILDQFLALRHVTLVYLVPVVVAATRLGILPAVISAIAGVGASAFLFYPPIYSFLVQDQEQLIELPLFVFVAIVTGHLATNLRRQADLARCREIEVHDLYAFSRRLAASHTPGDIHTAIREHLAAVIGHRTILLETVPRGGAGATFNEETVPEPVRRATEAIATGGERASNSVVDDEGRVWLVREVSGKGGDFGILAIDLGRQTGKTVDVIRKRVDAALADVTITLEHLDLGQAIADARVRSETDALRDALIGSVSHQLRTPMASIIGAATVISQAPGNAADPQLASLADVLRDEVDRLNNDVQDLLDAALISSKGIQLEREWVEPADIVNAAVDRKQRLLASHRIVRAVPSDLPFVYADPVLLEQALGQIVDNAAKYSQPGSTITVAVRTEGSSVVLSVRDEGIGLVREERTRLWERFFRGERRGLNVPGSGLGLWIAKAFVIANGGQVDAFSEGADRGTIVSIRLPVMEVAATKVTAGDDG